MPESSGVYRVIAGRRYEFPDEERARQWDALNQRRMQEYAEREGVLSQAATALKSVIPGVVRGTGLAATGIGSLFQAEAPKEFGRGAERLADVISEEYLGVKPYQRLTTGAMIGETLGAMAPAALGTAAAAAAIPETGGMSAALIPAIVGGVIGGAQGAGEVGRDIQEARERGVQVSPEQEQKLAAIQGATTGVLEGIPFGRLAGEAKALATAGRLAMRKPQEEAIREVAELLAARAPQLGMRALKSAAAEGSTEAAQQLVQNILARGDVSSITGPGYDPGRELLQSVVESGLVGAGFGGALQGGIDIYNKRQLGKFLKQQREVQAESPEIERQLEDAVLSREIAGQREEQIAAGILAEKKAKELDDALTSAMSALVDPEQLKQKISSDLFGSEYNLLDKKQSRKVDEKLKKELPSPFQRMRAYQEIAARDQFGKLYSELSDAKADESDKSELDIANEFARDLFQRRVDPNSIAIGIQVKEREAPGAVEAKPQPPIEAGPVFAGDLPESEIARLQEEDRKKQIAQAEANLNRPIKAPTSRAYIDAEGRVVEPGPALYQKIQRQKYVPEPVIEGSLEAEKAKGLPQGRLSEEGVFVPDSSLEYEAEAQQRIDDRLQPESLLGKVVQATDQQIGQKQESLKQAYEPAPPPSMEQLVEATAEMPKQIEIEEAQAAEDRQFSRYKKFDRDEYRSVLEGLKSTPDAAISSSYLAKNFGLTPPAANSMMSLMRSRGDIKESDGKLFVNPEAEGPMYKLRKRRGTPPAAAATVIAPVQPERGTPIPTVPRLNLDVEAARKVSSGAYQQLRKLNVSDLYSLVVVDNFLTDKGEIDPAGAAFLNNVIKLASKENNIAESEENLINTVNHEVVHGMRKSGFFSDAQWNLLTSKFTPQGELDQETVAAYQDRFKNETPERLNEILKEEAVAHAIERLGNEPAKPLSLPEKTLMQKVKDLARIGTSANNLGYTAEDLISAVRAGDVGRRAIPGQPTMLDAAKAGRQVAQPQVEAAVAQDISEDVTEGERAVAEEGDEVPEELKGSISEEPAEQTEPPTIKEAPERELGKAQAKEQDEDEAMFKLPRQNKPKLFRVNEEKSLLDIFKTNPINQIPAAIRDAVIDKPSVRKVIGPGSSLGKVLSLRQDWLQADAPSAKLQEKLYWEKGDEKYTNTASSAISAIRQSQKFNELLSSALNDGYIYFDKAVGFFRVKKDDRYAIMPQFKKLAAKGKLYQAWDAAIAQRFVDVENSGRDAKSLLGGTFTLKQAQDAVDQYKNDADIQEFLKVYRNFNNALIDLNLYVGNYDAATAAKLKAWFYSPYYRVPVDENGYLEAPSASVSRITNLQSAKAISGRELDINDAIENFITNAQYMVGYAMKNQAARRSTRDAVDGKLATRLEGKDDKGNLISSPRLATDKSKVVRVNEGGKRVYYEIHDPLLYKSLNNTQVRLASLAVLGRGFSNWLRTGVTSAPTFMLNNMFLDAFRLWGLGIYQDNFFKSIAGNIASGIQSVRKEDDAYQTLVRAGLIGNMKLSRDSVQAAMDIRRQLAIEQGNAFVNLLRQIKNYTLGTAEAFSAKSEAVNRVQVYKNVKKDMAKQGLSPEAAESAALFAAMEYPVNFDVRGNGEIAQYAAALFPFVNASAQGTDVFYRNIRAMAQTRGVMLGGKKQRTPVNQLQAAALDASKRVLVSSLVYGTLYTFFLAASDNEEWKKATPDERNRTLFLPVGFSTIKIPVPPEMGMIALALPNAFAEAIYGQDNGKQILKHLASYFANLFTFSPVPQIVRPAAEVALNKNFFTWRPIENMAQQKLSPEYRYDETTTGVGRGLGVAAEKLSMPISPIQFDHLIRGYLGTSGIFVSDLIGQLFGVALNKNEPERFRPLTDPYLLPGIGKKFAAPTDRKAIDDYYQIRNMATQAANNLKAIDAARVYETDPQKLRSMAYWSQVNKALEAGPEKRMEELRKLKNQVQSAPASVLTPAQKTDMLKQINLKMNEVARGVQHLKRHVPFTWF